MSLDLLTTPPRCYFVTFIHTLGVDCDRGFDGLPFWL